MIKGIMQATGLMTGMVGMFFAAGAAENPDPMPILTCMGIAFIGFLTAGIGSRE